MSFSANQPSVLTNAISNCGAAAVSCKRCLISSSSMMSSCNYFFARPAEPHALSLDIRELSAMPIE